MPTWGCWWRWPSHSLFASEGGAPPPPAGARARLVRAHASPWAARATTSVGGAISPSRQRLRAAIRATNRHRTTTRALHGGVKAAAAVARSAEAAARPARALASPQRPQRSSTRGQVARTPSRQGARGSSTAQQRAPSPAPSDRLQEPWVRSMDPSLHQYEYHDVRASTSVCAARSFHTCDSETVQQVKCGSERRATTHEPF